VSRARQTTGRAVRFNISMVAIPEKSLSPLRAGA
jgi:hypothetical protein